jgi:hypothetical protein
MSANPRLQRTRMRAPLSRQPLEGPSNCIGVWFGVALVLVLSIGLPPAALGDQEAMPTTYITASPDGHYYFRMYPDSTDAWNRDGGHGEAYEVSGKGRDKRLWRVKGWFAYQTFIAWDGQHLIRMGNWPRGKRPSSTDLAIAFYKRDRLLKAYSTADLIKDVSKVRASVSHYQFLADDAAPRLGNFFFDEFLLKTIDGIEYRFDFTTGEVLK